MMGIRRQTCLSRGQKGSHREAPNNIARRSATPAGRFKEICHVKCKTSDHGQRSQG